MRRLAVVVLMILLCLLCACGSKETDALRAPMDFRAQLQSAGGCTFTAEVTLKTDARTYPFTLECDCNTDGTGTVTVLAPDTIAGITARLEEDGGQLQFDGMALDFGTPQEMASPLAAPLTVVGCWAREYIADAGMEDDNLRVRYEKGYDADTICVNTWFDTKKNTPIYAEICYNSEAVIKITVKDFILSGGGEHETTETDVGGYIPGQSES